MVMEISNHDQYNDQNLVIDSMIYMLLLMVKNDVVLISGITVSPTTFKFTARATASKRSAFEPCGMTAPAPTTGTTFIGVNTASVFTKLLDAGPGFAIMFSP